MKLERILAETELARDYRRIIRSNDFLGDKIKEAVQKIRGIHQVKRYLGHVDLLSKKWSAYLDDPPVNYGIAFAHYAWFSMDLPFYTRAFSKVEEEFSDVISDIILQVNKKTNHLSKLAYVFETPYNKNWGNTLPYKKQRQQYFSLLHKLQAVDPDVIADAHYLLSCLIKNQEKEYPLEKIVSNICELDKLGDDPHLNSSSVQGMPETVRSLAQTYIEGLNFLAGPTYIKEFEEDLNLKDILNDDTVDLHFEKVIAFAKKCDSVCNQRNQLTNNIDYLESVEYKEIDSKADKYNGIVGAFAMGLPIIQQLNPSAVDDYVHTASEMIIRAVDINKVELAFKSLITHMGGYKLISTGIRSIVVFSGDSISKFSSDISYEAELHHKLENPINVVSAVKESNTEITLELKYIHGHSLEELMDINQLSLDLIKKYSSGIFNGLQELRQVGIYQHRDIRPANIMVDEEKERAIIIDLGIATTDPLDPPKDNRRYGGPNDLVSLGQVMYKMATGEHIFAESESMERTIYADELKDHRDWIYGGDERLDPYLRIVNETVTDDKVADLIKLCLTAKGTEEDYQRLEERFENIV
jgi:hypothetical protein